MALTEDELNMMKESCMAIVNHSTYNKKEWAMADSKLEKDKMGIDPDEYKMLMINSPISLLPTFLHYLRAFSINNKHFPGLDTLKACHRKKYVVEFEQYTRNMEVYYIEIISSNKDIEYSLVIAITEMPFFRYSADVFESVDKALDSLKNIIQIDTYTDSLLTLTKGYENKDLFNSYLDFDITDVLSDPDKFNEAFDDIKTCFKEYEEIINK